MDRETIQTLLDLLNPLHGSLDEQTYDEKVKENFDAPRDYEYNVNVTAQMERDLTQVVCILEDRLSKFPKPFGTLIPRTGPEPVVLSAGDLGITLDMSEETRREIEEIERNAATAAHNARNILLD